MIPIMEHFYVSNKYFLCQFKNVDSVIVFFFFFFYFICVEKHEKQK